MQEINITVKPRIEEFLLNVYWTRQDIVNFCQHVISKDFTCNIGTNTKRKDILENFFIFIDTSSQKIKYYKKLVTIIKEWNFDENNYWYKEGKLNYSIAKSIQIDFMKLEINEKKEKQEEKIKEFSIDTIKKNFYSMVQNNNLTPQQKGFEFEEIFYQIAVLEGITHRKPYRVNETMEQIDGTLKIENNNYLVELKFTKNEVNFSTIASFAGKLSTKGCYPRGIFVSMEGFSDGSILNSSFSAYKNIILLDSVDFMNILEGVIKLEELLIKKIEILQTKGYFYYDPVNNLNKYDLIIKK